MTITFPNENLPYTPFLVIGSGIAGLYTALQLAEQAEVTLITKETLAESNTAYAQGGIAAAISPTDSPKLHFEDTIRVGAGLCSSSAVRILVEEGAERVRELLALGVPFDRRQSGEPALTQEAAHSRRRILHADGDATGREISRTLIDYLLKNPRIRVLENTFAAALLTSSSGCRGALAVSRGADGSKTFQPLTAGATVLCAGGCGQVFASTTNPRVATGDGVAMAYRAGAPVADLEFVQFHPTALYLPPASSFLISESVRGEGALLRTKRGDRFMPAYHPDAELASRDVVARSIFLEMQRSGDEYVLLDLSPLSPELIKTRFPNIYKTCLRYGLDITKEPIPVAPAAHYMMGGVLTDLWGCTGLPSLFACGEAANTGVHGANRLASNSLLEGLVFGRRIAEYLKAFSPPSSITDRELRAELAAETLPQRTEEEIQRTRKIVSEKMGIIRDSDGLSEANRLLAPGSQSLAPLPEENYLELQNLRLTARLMVQSALMRTESRGSHYRADFPQTDPNWAKRILLYPERMEMISAAVPPSWGWRQTFRHS